MRLSSSARRWMLDIALAVGATYAAVILTDEASSTFLGRSSLTATILAVVYGGTTAFRRVAPRVVLIIQGLAALGYALVGLPVYMLGPAVLVTVYTVASGWTGERPSRCSPSSKSSSRSRYGLVRHLQVQS